MKTHYLVLLTFLFALSAITPGLAISLTNNITTADQSALLALKSQLRIEPSHILSVNWSDSTSVCSWIGVTCSYRHHERVTGLDLSFMNLTTSLPQQIRNLSFLVSLNLSHNNFYGSIPRELSQLRRLRILDFSVNNLQGEIPATFSFMSKLELLFLSNNSLTGTIPPLSNMSTMQALDLSNNTLYGGIPTDIGDLINLKTLDLSYNQLSDIIPPTFFNLSTMEIAVLRGNRLSGNLPESLCGGLPMLEDLRLSVNVLSGEIPANLSTCSRLRILYLSGNSFSGTIPRGIGELSRVEGLALGRNNLTGEIPSELGNMTSLKILLLGDNQLTGSITTEALNISSLQTVNLGLNNLRGILPADIWSYYKQLQSVYFNDNNLAGTIPHYGIENLSNLERFSLAANNFSGFIPLSIFNISSLKELSLSDNHFVGNLPPDLGSALPYLEVLGLHNNSLSSASVELSFVTSLTRCRNLIWLGMCQNSLNGVLPSSIGNFSTSLQNLCFSETGLTGKIPDVIGNLTSLIRLDMWGNSFTGTLPVTLVSIQSLQYLDLSHNNRISGTIPSKICESENMFRLYLDDNEFHGHIPPCIGNITTLSTLDLNTNNLTGTIPISLWRIRDILRMNLSSNSLTGNLPVEVGNLRSVTVIDFSMNQLSGAIPATIGNLEELRFLSLSGNILNGNIPESIAEILNLEFLDFSHNNLSGRIPALMENLTHLDFLNFSFNGLSGEIPSGGAFENFTSSSFMFNLDLCGDVRYNVTPCHEDQVAKPNRKIRVVFITLGASILLIVIIALTYGFVRSRKKNKSLNKTNMWVGPADMRISYYELLDATDRYNESHLIDNGSFGSVYKGNLRNGKTVAIKVFHAQRDGACDSFEAECEMLRKLRHRNLCGVIGCCSNGDFKALILEYMPNGSLEKILYSTDSSLDLVNRISIMIDVASALEYLHYGHSSTSPIVHCDLKPSNILLDENMVGHLCDFGLAKLLGGGESVTQTMTLATLGYVAPEFGTDGRVSIRSDVYSYGITLMEVLTERRPNDELFTGELSLRSWVEDTLTAGAIVHIIDPNLVQVQEDEERSNLMLNCVHSIMELALRCTCECPHDRINIKDVNASLKKIRSSFEV